MNPEQTFEFKQQLEQRKKQECYRKRLIINSAQGPIVHIEDQPYLNFSSNDYLGFANNPLLKNYLIEATKKYGIGAGSSTLLLGYTDAHQYLESKLAEFLNRDAALVFSSGYQANLAIASALIDDQTVVLQDKLNHASLIDAGLLSKGKLCRYKHNDCQHLKQLFEKYKNKKLILLTDGIFSMDGDHALLHEISSLCETYNAILIVDDAHGLGVFGKTGGGLLETLSLSQEQVPLLIGTFAKSFGAAGAFIAGKRLLIEQFLQKARTYIYTTALMPAIASTMGQAIDLVINATVQREKINQLIKVYKQGLRQNGMRQSCSPSQIQPFMLGKIDKAVQLGQALKDKQILVATIRPPTVPKNTARLRISLTAAHSETQVEQLLNSIAASG